MSTLLETWSPFAILQPAQEPWMAAIDAAAFGPNQTIYAGQAVAKKTADGKLYAYSSGGTLTAPGAPTGVVSAGGNLANGAYLAKVVARYGTGNSAGGTESAAATATTGNNTVTWTWAAVAGATSYDFYRTAAAGASGTEVFIVSIPANVTTFTDTGAIAPGTATVPSASSAPTDGTQTCVGLSENSFTTDSAGNAYLNYANTPGQPASSVASWRLGPQPTMTFFKRGTFDPADLTGFDSAAQTSMQVRVLPCGYYLIP